VEETFLTAETVSRLERELRTFRQSAKARVVFLIDRNGQLLAQAGDTSKVDTTAIAALTASNIAASRAIAELLGEEEFGGVIHEGQREHIHISLVDSQAIMVVLFDAQTSLGLVRLRVKTTAQSIADLFTGGAGAAEADEEPVSPFAEITEEDIDQLFR
jgi:predicted regulator of Ras-like GTPase activity (Roadblock/LC7/MglB family)